MAANPSNRASRPLLLGHRGFRYRGLQRLAVNSPVENSLAAFEFALSQGCDGFEFDVRRTRDGRNVLWHDPEWSGRQIAATDYNALADRNGSNLACLEDVLHQFGHRAYLDIELKMPGNEENVLSALKAVTPQRGFIVSSFLPGVLARLNNLDSALPLGYICDRREGMDIWRELPITVLLPRHDMVRPQLVEEVHQCGLTIMTWTVNSSRLMRELATWGIDGLISDDAALLCQTFHIA